MGEALARAAMDRARYLDWEANQPDKHEYLRGEVFAMVGVRREHALLTLALGALLRQHLKARPCQVFVADMKLHVAAADAYFYPDVMVSCAASDRRAELAIEAPSLVVEVLSEGTAAFDRGEKFAAYRQLPSLQEYLLVSIETRRLELYRRAEDHWRLQIAEGAGATLELVSVGLSLGLSEVFEDLDPLGDSAASP